MRAKRARKQNQHQRHCFAKVKRELHRGEAKMKKSKASCLPRRRRTFTEEKLTFAEAKGSILKIEGLRFVEAKKTFTEAKEDPLKNCHMSSPRRRMSGLGQKCPHSQPHFGHFSNALNTCIVIFLGTYWRELGVLAHIHFLGVCLSSHFLGFVDFLFFFSCVWS